jgi:kynurenine formamidase
MKQASSVAFLLMLSFFGGACNNAPTRPPEAAVSRPAFAYGSVVDLSHAFDEQTAYWPTAEPFKSEKDFEGVTDKGYFYSAKRFSAAEHGGTHVDAPVHFAEGRNTVDQIPLEQLIGSAVVVDVSRKCEADADYQVTAEDFAAWEREHGQLADGVLVILRTGFGRRWPDRKAYMGTDERGAAAVPKLHFPGLHPDAARWLVSERRVKAVGIDTPSIDYGQSTLFESHRVLFDKNIPALENLANLDALPAKDFHLVALPMKIKGGTGGPLRVVAFLQK